MRSCVDGVVSPINKPLVGIMEAYGPKKDMMISDVGVGHVPKTPRDKLLSPIQKTMPVILEKSLAEGQTRNAARGLSLKDRLTQ